MFLPGGGAIRVRDFRGLCALPIHGWLKKWTIITRFSLRSELSAETPRNPTRTEILLLLPQGRVWVLHCSSRDLAPRDLGLLPANCRRFQIAGGRGRCPASRTNRNPDSSDLNIFEFCRGILLLFRHPIIDIEGQRQKLFNR